jgi:hypothetical protein
LLYVYIGSNVVKWLSWKLLYKYVGEGDPKIYPKHLNKLPVLEFVLRVKYQPYYHHSSVLGVSRDPAIIKKIKSHLQPNEIQPEEQQLDDVLCACPVHFFIIDLTVSFSFIYIWFSILLLLNIIYDKPTQSFILEKNN